VRFNIPLSPLSRLLPLMPEVLVLRQLERAARAHIAEGTHLFALAGRPTKTQSIKVYGPRGPKMTWAQRAKAGVDAKHFQQALQAKS